MGLHFMGQHLNFEFFLKSQRRGQPQFVEDCVDQFVEAWVGLQAFQNGFLVQRFVEVIGEPDDFSYFRLYLPLALQILFQFVDALFEVF